MARSPTPNEVFGGYYVLEADDLDAALEVATRIPAAPRRLGRDPSDRGATLIEQVFRAEWCRVLACLTGDLGDLDLAEDGRALAA